MARVLFSSLPFKNFLTLIEELSLLVSTFTFTFKLGNRPVALSRASDISRKKRKISRDFQGQIRGKIGRFRGIFAGKKSKFAEKSADLAGKESKFAEKSADFAGF